jgi:hypothetical protein
LDGGVELLFGEAGDDGEEPESPLLLPESPEEDDLLVLPVLFAGHTPPGIL